MGGLGLSSQCAAVITGSPATNVPCLYPWRPTRVSAGGGWWPWLLLVHDGIRHSNLLLALTTAAIAAAAVAAAAIAAAAEPAAALPSPLPASSQSSPS